jgi:hypothetical protein
MTNYRRPHRRHYTAEWPSEDLHAVAAQFDRARRTADLSERQEWLYDCIIAELTYRRQAQDSPWRQCSCWYCFGPFDQPEVPF